MNKLMSRRALITAFILLVLACVIQSLGSFNNDVASLLYDTQLMLTKGAYVNDFFETNPPMIFYIYTPVILISKLIPLSLAVLFRIYLFAWIGISMICCFKLLKQIFVKDKDDIMLGGFFIVLFFILLFLPGNEFGQREHFLMIFMLPYLFSAVLAAQNKKIHWVFAVWIGLMAGMGFGLKPYFLLPVILIECYLIVIKRHLFAWIRVESIVCLSVLTLYLASVFIFYKTYIHIMLPLISHLYFMSTKEPWIHIFISPSVVFCVLVWIGFFVFFKQSKQRELIAILMLSLTGMIAAFLVPRAAWFYHVLPAMGLACLLAWLYGYNAISILFKDTVLSRVNICFLIASGLFIFSIPFYYCILTTEKAIKEKNSTHFNLLTAYINSLPCPRGIYCFSVNTTLDCFPLVYQTHSDFAGRFPFFWWLRGLLKLEMNTGNALSPVIARDKNYLIDKIAEDLNRYQARVIIVNKLFESEQLGDDFDFVAYFSQNVNFRAAWRPYHYLKTIDVYQIYIRS